MIISPGATPTSTREDLTGRLILVTPLTYYRVYFARAETDTFLRKYATILSPYNIEASNAAAAVGTQEVDC